MTLSEDDLVRLIPGFEKAQQRTFLHIGCGYASRERLPLCFASEAWTECTLDVDEAVAPDIVGSMTQMESVDTESMDALIYGR